MAHINVLPWREWERERRKNEFIVRIGLAILAGAAIVFGAGSYFDTSIETQNKRNQFLEGKIAMLDTQIVEIKNLQQERQQLLDRMRVIQELQGNRPVIVHIFDELVRTLSKGVYYKSLSMSGNNLNITGIAESNNRISSLMRQLNSSEWFAEPNLKGIRENTDAGAQASNFTLTVVHTNPNKVSDEEG